MVFKEIASEYLKKKKTDDYLIVLDDCINLILILIKKKSFVKIKFDFLMKIIIDIFMFSILFNHVASFVVRRFEKFLKRKKFIFEVKNTAR